MHAHTHTHTLLLAYLCTSFCCTFLAFKIDEYNVTLEQFIETLSPFFPPQQLQHLSDFILSHEVCQCVCVCVCVNSLYALLLVLCSCFYYRS